MSDIEKNSHCVNGFEKGLGRYLSPVYLKRAATVYIAIAGCGGIGSNCAHNLVRCGFKQFLLIDHDVVDVSNLNRQFYFIAQKGHPKVEMLKENLLAINHDLNITTIQEEIKPNTIDRFFHHCDVIVEAFDNVVSKKLLAETYFNSDKLIVSVSGIAGSGNSDDIIIKKIKNKFYMVGDFTSEISETLHPYSPKINIAAAKQADIIFDYYQRMGEHPKKKESL
ncbi:MAG: sulfur carrier protein ThiS adenylyltransferase ThiF [Candidatus Magnetomorum sp.]|nr:sulfur carrier protein ThiS adenylyltransferase ThiF [Candidatus Magnetomorum sp.]